MPMGVGRHPESRHGEIPRGNFNRSHQKNRIMSSLREKAAQYIKDKGIPETAAQFNKKESTIKQWLKTGNYPVDLMEAALGYHGASEQEDPNISRTEAAQAIHSAPPPKPTEALDGIAQTLSQVVDKLQELHEWKNGMDERFNPRAVQPQPPSRTVPPAVTDDQGFVEASSTRPGPMAPTPHIVRGEAPPAMAPPPQVEQPAAWHQRKVRHWTEPYEERYRR